MFATLDGTSRGERREHGGGRSPSGPRPKRAQVQRACNPCRVNRIKCDTGRPCRNCETHNRRCVDRPLEIKSLAAATEEIDRLRTRIQELEEKYRRPASPSQDPGAEGRASSAVWTGVRIDDLYYGPSSLDYFEYRLWTFLRPFFQPQFDLLRVLDRQRSSGSKKPPKPVLTRPQQDYYINLYWQWYHPLYPVIAGRDFKKHYELYWAALDAPDNPTPSCRLLAPLVDMMTAVSIQCSPSLESIYGSGPLPCLDSSSYCSSCDSTLAPCHNRPCLINIQCRVLSVLYLLNEGHVNSAQTVIAQAIRIATILGYNYELTCHDPDDERDLFRRIWWMLYVLDSQIGIMTGRPFMMDSRMTFCRRPSDSPDMASTLGAAGYGEPDPPPPWLAYYGQYLGLTETARAVHSSFYAKCDQLIAEAGGTDIYQNAAVREECARHLINEGKRLTLWADNVPAILQIPRQSGKPLSMGRSAFLLDKSAPVWLQRQRVQLELEYHHLRAGLYRSFICFSSNLSLDTLLTESNATSALKHALVTTDLIRQLSAETKLVTVGWPQIFAWQKSATMVIVGFALGYPGCVMVPGALAAAELSLEILEIFAHDLERAELTVAQVRDLMRTVQTVLARQHAGISVSEF